MLPEIQDTLTLEVDLFVGRLSRPSPPGMGWGDADVVWRVAQVVA
jgi:hypothetical protein